jgi:hypothetical protein
LGIPKGTLSGWFRNEEWSKDIALKNSRPSAETISARNATRRASRQAQDEFLKKQARSSFAACWPEPVFVAGLALYWGEGDKRTRHQVRITNTDPGIIRSFQGFLKKYGGNLGTRIWISLIIYEDLDRRACESFWQEESGIAPERFHRTVVIKGRGTERRSPHGICILGVSSTPLKTTILTWIEEMEKRL